MTNTVTLPPGFQWDEPRPCALCWETSPTYYAPQRVWLHPECLSEFEDDGA